MPRKKQEKWISAQATFPSALVYHGPRPWLFEQAFHDAGKVIRLR